MRLQARSHRCSRPDGRGVSDAVEQPMSVREPNASGARPIELAGRITSVGARRRLEGELRSIAVDLLGPNESDEFPPDCAEWVKTTTDAAVSRVSDSALEALLEALDARLTDAPPGIARRLDDARVRHGVGFV
jgi:hypothetical protein